MESNVRSKRPHNYVSAGLILLCSALAYVFLSTQLLSHAERVSPADTIRLPDAFGATDAGGVAGGSPHAFANNVSYGYYSEDGTIGLIKAMRAGVALDDEHLLESDPANGIVRLTSVKTGATAIIPLDGFPFIGEKRLFIVRPDQKAITEIDGSGRFLWSHEFGTLITACSISRTLTVWGLLDGSVQFVDQKGLLVGDIQPGSRDVSSLYSCVYGAAISGDAKLVAMIYGLEPQYFLVYGKNNGVYTLAHKRKLAEPVRSAQAIAFSEDGTSVLARSAGGFIYYDEGKKKSTIIQARYSQGSRTTAKILPMHKDMFASLLSDKEKSLVAVFRKGSLLAMFPVANDAADISYHDGILAVAGSRAVTRFKVGEK